MDERFLVLQTPGPHRQPTRGRQQVTNVHILKPALRNSGNDYEHILDFGLPLEGPPSELPRFRNGFNSAKELGQRVGKDLNFPLGDKKHTSCTPPRTPALDTTSSWPSGDNLRGPPSWSQTRFKLDRPVPSCVPTVPFPHPGRNVQLASDFLHPHDQGDLLRSETGRRRANNNMRKSCEYCRFRKKKCSGNDVCIRCFRVGVHCVYMPDLVAKRAADCLPGTSSSTRTSCPSPSSGTRNLKELEAGQLSRIHSSASCVVSSGMNDVPVETPAQPSEKARRRSMRATGHQENLRAGNYLTQAMVLVGSQPMLQSGGPNLIAGDLGSGHCGLALGLTSGAFDVAAGDANPQSPEPQCVTPSALDRKTHTTTVPKHQNISNPRDVFYDHDITQPGHFEHDIHTTQPTPTTTRSFPQLKESLDAGPTGAEAAPISEFNVLSPLETGLSLEPYMDLSAPSPSPSSTLVSSSLPMLSDFVQDYDLMQAWMVDEWLTWYDYIPFCNNHDSPASSGPRRFSRK